MKLSSEQQSVVDASHERFTVRASAGSGKTSVLVERYIRQVVELGLTPDEIVTVTFTRKAAAEMKSRIVSRLRGLGMLEEAQIAETGPVQTIHSLCERILRENAIAALVSPDFQVLETSRASILRDEAIRFALLAAIEEDTPARPLVESLSGRGTYRDAPWSHGRIRNAVGGCLDKLRNSGLERQEFMTSYSDPETLLAFWKSELFRTLPEVAGSAEDHPGPNWGQSVETRLKAASHRVPHWVKVQSGDTDLTTAQDTVGLVWLSTVAWETMEARMEAEMEFDFPLLESKAVALLRSSVETGLKLRKRWKALLVDEAQDLNPAQYRLFEYLAIPSEMLVGDAQQSIYSFRYAERGLFIDRSREEGLLHLSRNFRSEQPVLRFVDHVFGDLWGEEYVPMATAEPQEDDPFASGFEGGFDGVEVWPMASKDSTTLAALVKQVVDEGVSPGDIAVLCHTHGTIQTLAGKLRDLGIAFRTVGASEVFFTRLEVRDLANALEAVSDPYDDFAMLAFARSPFVGVSLDTAVVCASQSHVFEALRSDVDWPNGDRDRLDAAWPWFDRIRSTVDSVPAWETLANLLNETAYLSEIAKAPNGLQSVANVRKLLELATKEPNLTASQFAARIRDVRSLRHKEGEAPIIDDSEPAVTVMTVFAAKGLEFDVVVVAETQRRLSKRRDDVVVDAPKALVATNFWRKASAAFAWLSSEMERRSTEEGLRVLYVAMTRARKRLCVETAEVGGHESVAAIVARRAGLPKSVLPGLRVRRLTDR